MNYKYQKLTGVVCLFLFLIMIIDTKTAINAATQGIDICICSILPSLFPFFLLSAIIGPFLSNLNAPILSKFCSLLGIPTGAESYFFLGLLSGYPVGAENINNSCKNNLIPLDIAERMLGFCSNAGPAFIFGMLGPMFHLKIVPWALWIIHIIAAVIVGAILPGKRSAITHSNHVQNCSFSSAMSRSVNAIASVCGWVIIFRVIITFLQKWLLWRIPGAISVLFFGILELSNGCLSLDTIPSQGIRFILAAFFLGSGGFCVAMQTVSVTKEIGLGLYFPGKIMQSAISVILACLLQFLLFSGSDICKFWFYPMACSLITIVAVFLYWKSKNNYSILKKIVV